MTDERTKTPTALTLGAALGTAILAASAAAQGSCGSATSWLSFDRDTRALLSP